MSLGVLAAAVVAAFVILSACMAPRPSLHANIGNGAEMVPLNTNLQIVADGALLQQAMLVRLDVPSDPISLDKTANGAQMNVTLEPDAQYKLVASAEPAAKTSLPWESSPSAQLSLEQTFSTVETPVLQDPDSTRTLLRNKPVELTFSQPLAQASVSGASATAAVSKSDPHVLRVQVADPTPGADLTLHLTDVVGTDGVTAPDAEVALQVPSAVALTSVSDKSPSAKIALAADVPVTLQWNKPVSSVTYTVDDKPTTWSGAATDTLKLPVKPEEGQTQTVSVTDAVAADGGWLAAPQTFDLLTAPPLKIAAMWPENGNANVSPSSPPIFRFSDDIGDRAAAEAAITFDPSTPGHFEWLAANRVQYVPDKAFPSDTEVTVHIDGNPRQIRSAAGSYLDEPVTATYTTGKLKVIDVSLSKQLMTLYEDGEVAFSVPVATGVAAAPTPPGDYKVEYKMPVARFRGVNPDGSHYDIPDVHWVMPFYGDYTIHGAYWRPVFGRPGSDGCVSMSDANAKRVFDWAEEGTPVHIHN